MNDITVSAKTYDEAITKALIDLQTTSDHLKVETVQEGSSGFLGLLVGGYGHSMAVSVLPQRFLFTHRSTQVTTYTAY